MKLLHGRVRGVVIRRLSDVTLTEKRQLGLAGCMFYSRCDPYLVEWGQLRKTQGLAHENVLIDETANSNQLARAFSNDVLDVAVSAILLFSVVTRSACWSLNTKPKT